MKTKEGHKILNEIFIFNVAKLAVKSMINAASVYPKPGLVTPLDNDALDGTDYPCFVDGAMSLFQSFVNCASAGIETENLKPDDAFTILQGGAKVGADDVLRATRGRLSMRGYVLCMGLLCSAAGRLTAQKRILTPGALTLTASSFVQGIIERELWPVEDAGGGRNLTAGVRAYLSYGLEGCRGEAEHGYTQTLRAVEVMRRLDATQGQLNFREKLTHTLIEIMTANDDTCIAAHAGISGLLKVQDEAKSALNAGGMTTSAGIDAVFEMDKELRTRGISPRGSAVILACAMFIPELGRLRLTRSGYDE